MTLILAFLDAIETGLADAYIAFVSMVTAAFLGLMVYAVASLGARR
jgi:hypothetical protein